MAEARDHAKAQANSENCEAQPDTPFGPPNHRRLGEGGGGRDLNRDLEELTRGYSGSPF